MMIAVFRQSPDGLSRERWDFRITASGTGSIALLHDGYGIERRKSARGRFSKAPPAERWRSSDERRYNSGLPRPFGIPVDVIAEAVGQIKVDVHLGWTREEDRIATLRLTTPAQMETS